MPSDMSSSWARPTSPLLSVVISNAVVLLWSLWPRLLSASATAVTGLAMECGVDRQTAGGDAGHCTGLNGLTHVGLSPMEFLTRLPQTKELVCTMTFGTPTAGN